METQRERPVSSRTFGHLTPRAPTPPLQRSRSARSQLDVLETERPPLLRGRTPEPETAQADVAKMYSSNMFADPANKRAWYKGPHLFTDGHQRLVYMLREECGRLYSFSQRQKRDLQASQAATQQARAETQTYKTRLHDVRGQLADANNRLREQQDELAEKQDTLEELDALYQATRNKRMSRNMDTHGITFDVAQVGQQAQAYQVQLGEHAS